MEILTVKNLSFTYPNMAAPTLKDISFSVQEGEFLLVAGATGCGKSTLLRLLKKELAPLGALSGELSFMEKPMASLSEEESASAVGYVLQRPEQQIVTDKVWHELAFGPENLGVPQNIIRRRVAEISSYFGIEDWFEKDVSSLSGGQKQLLSLASVMVMEPKILLLDEPTSQLDPIAAAEFIATVSKLHRELSMTVIMIEHRFEEVLPVCDKMMILDDGRLLTLDSPRRAMGALGAGHRLAAALPAAAKLFLQTGGVGDVPLSVREGREYLRGYFANDVRALPKKEKNTSEKEALSFANVFFRYERNAPDVLKGLSFGVRENEIFCILGGNGSGKTTTLLCAAGIRRFYDGHVRVFGKKLKDYKNGSLYKECLGYLPQDVQTVFLKNTVREELAEAGATADMLPYDLTPLYDKHPYDLSGGEQQLVALAKVLASKPRLLLLDEPTKALDAFAAAGIADVLKTLAAQGMTVVAVTHDTDFAAKVADRCALFFRGEMISIDEPQAFFAANTFYTTTAARITKGYYDGVVTAEDAAALCLLNGRKDGAP